MSQTKNKIIILTIFFQLFTTINFAQSNVICEKPTIGNISKTLSFTGSTKPIIETFAASDVSGPLLKIFVEDGMKVKANQTLAQIDTTRFKIIQRRAMASLERAKQILKEAKIDFNRNKKLFNKGAITQKTFDNAETASIEADSDYKLAKENYEQAALDLTRCSIKAPINGFFVNRSVDPGQAIARGQNIGKVIDLSSIYVDAKIADSDVNKISIGQRCIIQNKYIGTISFINLYADKSRSFKVRIKVPNPNLIFKANMFVKGKVRLKTYKNVPLFDDKALRTEHGHYFVFLNKANKAIKRIISITAQVGDKVYSKEISATEELITTGQDELKNGQTITVIKPSLKDLSK